MAGRKSGRDRRRDGACDEDWLVDKGIDRNPGARAIAPGVDAQLGQRLIAAPDSLRQRVARALPEISVVGFDGITGGFKPLKHAACSRRCR